ncbi:MAG: radical SAM protein [Planctomycetota bacterium]|jgi:sulfatase maturation enzyme AslB (radical SAM superfamily)
MRHLLLAAVARAYLRKPDLQGFLDSRLPDLRSLFSAARNELAFRAGLHRLPELTTLNVELTSRCNVACTYCDVNRGLGRAHRDLDLRVLRRLLEETPGLTTLLPFQWGEPLLYEALDEALELASRRGMRSYLTTNGTLLDGARLRRLNQAGLTRLTVSLDGSAATHHARRGYAQDAILERLADARAVRDNERLAVALDVSMVVDESVADQIAGFRARFLPLVDRVQFIPRLARGRRSQPCREPSRGVLVVLSDGSVTTCCADNRGELRLGHVDDGPPRALYGGPAFVSLRRRHRAREFPAPCDHCTECAVPGVSERFA